MVTAQVSYVLNMHISSRGRKAQDELLLPLDIRRVLSKDIWLDIDHTCQKLSLYGLFQ